MSCFNGDFMIIKIIDTEYWLIRIPPHILKCFLPIHHNRDNEDKPIPSFIISNYTLYDSSLRARGLRPWEMFMILINAESNVSLHWNSNCEGAMTSTKNLTRSISYVSRDSMNLEVLGGDMVPRLTSWVSATLYAGRIFAATATREFPRRASGFVAGRAVLTTCNNFSSRCDTAVSLFFLNSQEDASHTWDLRVLVWWRRSILDSRHPTRSRKTQRGTELSEKGRKWQNEQSSLRSFCYSIIASQTHRCVGILMGISLPEGIAPYILTGPTIGLGALRAETFSTSLHPLDFF